MDNKPNRTFIMIITLLAGLCFFQNTNAYVLQGPHLLKLMAEALGKTKRLEVSQKLILYQTGEDENAIELQETLKYQFPGFFRSDIVTNQAQRIHVMAHGTPLIIVDKKITADYESEFDWYKDLLFYRTRSELERRLTACGVDVTVSSIGRFQGRIGYIIGGEYPDETVPEVWLDKETFRPFRWIMTAKSSKNGGDSLEIRYLGWRETNKTWYPGKIEFYRDDSLVRVIQVGKIRTDPRFKRKLFDIKHLKSVYPPETSLLENREGKEDSEVSEIQKTLDDFNKIFE